VINVELKNMRLAKLIAISGTASRREAEKLIVNGKVKVNNQITTNIITFITYFIKF
jgi:16S rRNA U516 pseudouridylate synthase RsuA-like enzyme